MKFLLWKHEDNVKIYLIYGLGDLNIIYNIKRKKIFFCLIGIGFGTLSFQFVPACCPSLLNKFPRDIYYFLGDGGAGGLLE